MVVDTSMYTLRWKVKKKVQDSWEREAKALISNEREKRTEE